MYTCYLSKYKEDGVIIDTPICIYDKRSPALDIRVVNPVLEFEDSCAGSFSFVLPQNHFMYDKIVEKLTEITIKDDEEVIFEGSVISNEKDWNMNKKIVSEGYPAYLNDTTQPRKEFFNISMVDYIQALIDIHNGKSIHKFVIGDVDMDFPEIDARSKRERMHDETITTRSEISIYESTQYESTMYYLMSLRARCGGHFIFTRIEKDKYRIDYKKELALDPNAQTIAIGENLLDYNESSDYQLLCTSVLPVARMSNGITSKIGDVLAIVPKPNLRLGYYSQIEQLTDSDCQVDDYIYVLNNSDRNLYIVTGFYKDLENVNRPNVKLLTKSFVLHEGCVLCRVDNDRNILPVCATNGNKDIREYRSRAFFPAGSTTLYYIANDTGIVWEYDGNDYYLSSANDIYDWLPYRVLEINGIDDIAPKVNTFYVSARSHNLGEIRGFDSKYLWALSYPGSLVAWGKINEEYWTSIKDEPFDISYSSSGANYHGSQRLLVAAWGNSIPPMIKREAYYYTTEDLTIGDELDFNEIIDGHQRAELLNNTFIFNYGEWYDDEWHWSIKTFSDQRYAGFSVLKLYVKDLCDKIYEEDMNNNPHANKTPRKLYISTRSVHYTDEERKEQYPDEARNDGPLWFAEDPSRQFLYKKDKDNNENMVFTSVINDTIDLNSPELYGAEYIYIGCFGAGIPVKANYYIEQSGSLQNYITVENASDYFIKLGEGETGDEQLHSEGSLYVESPSLISKYGRIERKVEFNNVNSPELLCEKAVDYLINSQFGETTRDIQGVDLHNQNVDIRKFKISTKVPVFSPAHKCNDVFDLLGLTITLDNPSEDVIRVSESITMEKRLKEASE